MAHFDVWSESALSFMRWITNSLEDPPCGHGLSSTTGPGVPSLPLWQLRCGFSSPASAIVTHASLMYLRLPCILTIVMRTCPVAPLVMGHPTAVSSASCFPYISLACLRVVLGLVMDKWIILVIMNAAIEIKLRFFGMESKSRG